MVGRLGEQQQQQQHDDPDNCWLQRWWQEDGVRNRLSVISPLCLPVPPGNHQTGQSWIDDEDKEDSDNEDDEDDGCDNEGEDDGDNENDDSYESDDSYDNEADEEAREEWELGDGNNEEEEGDIFNHLHIFSHWFEAVFVFKLYVVNINPNVLENLSL